MVAATASSTISGAAQVSQVTSPAPTGGDSDGAAGEGEMLNVLKKEEEASLCVLSLPVAVFPVASW